MLIEANIIQAFLSLPPDYDKKKIRSEIRRKNEIRDVHDRAMQDRRAKVLLDEALPEIFRVKVGQIKPGSEVQITVVYIVELPVEEHSVCFNLPSCVAPK